MVSRQLHNEGSGIATEHFGFLQHDTGDDDGSDAQEVSTGSHPPSATEQSRSDQSDDRHLSAAGNEGRNHDRHTAVALVFDGTGSHDARHAASTADQHGDEGLTGQTKAAEDTVHDESDTGHVAAGFQKTQEDEQDQHLRHEAQDSAHAADNAVQDQTLEPVSATDCVQSILSQNRDTGYPSTKLRGIRGIFHTGVVNGRNIIASLSQGVGIGAIILIKGREITIFDVSQQGVSANDASVNSILHGGDHFIGPHILFCVLVDGIFVLTGTHPEEMEAITEQAIIGPVSDPATDGRHRDEVHQNHDSSENRQGGEPVGDNTVDLIRNGHPAGLLFLVATLQDRGDVHITLVGDDAFSVIIQLGLSSLDILLHMVQNGLGNIQLGQHFVVALENLNGVPTLLLLRHIVDNSLFNVRQGVLNGASKGMLGNGLRRGAGSHGSVGSVHDAGAL